MRTLILTRGPQGAGKSTLIREAGLEGHRISADDLRRVYGAPVMTRSGGVGLPQDHDREVWPLLMRLLEARMDRGELTVMDATHPDAASFRPYRALARTYGYRLICVDFSDIPLELTLARNQRRAPWKRVPERSVRRTWEACRRGEVPEGVELLPWTEGDGQRRALAGALRWPCPDLSGFSSVWHVGDLQGCIAPLIDGGPLGGGVPEGAFVVFVGDYLDRGLENDRVLAWLLEHALGREDVVLLRGNHELLLERWVRGEEVADPELARTVAQLEAAGLGRAEAGALCEGLVDAFWYSWRGRRVLVNHGGLPTVPEHPERISTRQYAFGTGYYSDPVDAVFHERAPEGWVQVHGHRNPSLLRPQASPRSWSLEGWAEHGGHLRLLRLDEGGWTPLELPVTRYRSLARRLALGDPLAESPLNPPWVGPEMPPPTMPQALMEALDVHPLVRERPSPSKPWISSFNFTRDAFYDRSWDALNTKARGLFINTDSREIVARSYDKFFNLGERPETRLDALREGLRFPVTLSLKENGWLGILGYDAREGRLIFASKSSLESDFAGWFRELVEARLDAAARRRLRLYLRDTHSAMVFEAIDPRRDPHIIAYDEPGVVLLDLVRRAPRFEAAPYDTLVRVGRHFGLEVKQRTMTFQRWEAFAGWLQAATQPGWTFRGAPVEGFVLKDSAGFLTKLKLDYYSHWKRMRSLKQRLLKVRGTRRPLNRDLSEPRVRAFHDWAAQQPDEVLALDIITLRRRYLAGAPPPPRPPRSEAPETSEDRGFRAMLEGLSRHGAPFKRGTADAALARALASDRSMDLLVASPIKLAIILAASPGPERREVADRLGLDPDDAGPSEG